MMTNLFSVFDPCTGILSMNWISTFIFMYLLPYNFWAIMTKTSYIMNFIMVMLHKELKMLMNYNGTTLFMLSLFLVIFVNNLMGLFPYIFTASSHLMFSMSLAVPMWLTFMIYGWLHKTNYMFSHLVPTGTPTILMPFMVMIETISNIIRPGSLAVRLTANMIAGHLLMSLLGDYKITLVSFSFIMILFIMLMVFEMAVAMIQSYVFMTLMTLYSSEI
nr:ATP synthase F0 subunit 6 [Nionia sp.]